MTDSKQEYNNPLAAILAGVRDLLKEKKDQVSLKDSDRLDGKKVLLTGASSGLGFAAAVELARRGAHLIMAVRSGIPEKGEEVKKLSGSAKVDMVSLDLTRLDTLPDFAQEIKEGFGSLDVVICNAAVVTKQGRQVEGGQDEMFTVNYFAKFCLVKLFHEKELFNTEGQTLPRLIFVASESHRNASEFDWKHFGEFQPYGIKESVAMYGYTKLLMLTMANEFSRRINSKGMSTSVFGLCPGPVRSNLAREAPRAFQPLLKLVFWLFFRSPAKACRPLIYLAASKEIEGSSLDYLFLMQKKEMDPKCTDRDNGIRLWEGSEELLKAQLPNAFR